MTRLLMIDNYDSFTYNLVQMFMGIPGLDIRVARNDTLTPTDALALAPDFLVVSPGPKAPRQAGMAMPIIEAFYRRIPVLGVCLGMQCINELFGGHTVRAPMPIHGKTSRITHTGDGLFQGLASPLRVARYHSLAVAPAPDSPLTVTAIADDGVIMGLSHPDYPLHGVQFHPESFLSESGMPMIHRFLALGTSAEHPPRRPIAPDTDVRDSRVA